MFHVKHNNNKSYNKINNSAALITKFIAHSIFHQQKIKQNNKIHKRS